MFNILSDEALGRIIMTAAIIVGTFVVSYLVKKIIYTVFRQVPRARTLLKNISDILIFSIAILMILVEWGVNIGPILTGAGILGLAFSFGAQSLVKDLISGFFILLEGQFTEGDTIIIDNTIRGRVYRMTLRLTILKDKKENLIYVPNSQITKVVKLKS